MKQLKNKVANVTGGTSAIARAAAVGLTVAGSKSVVSGRRDFEGQETVYQTVAPGGEACFVKADVTGAAAIELATQGNRVNAVAPAAIETDMLDRFVGKEGDTHHYLTSLHPIGRVGKPEGIAGHVVWLASDHSSFITGYSLSAVGGFTAQ
jgi:NAD(P)-dependent dehydrogenase (short-subunit alcohol dehydrogenase family)